MTDDAGGEPGGAVLRGHSWHGVKPVAKKVLSWRVPHLAMRGCVRLVGSRIRYERLPAPASLSEVDARMAGVSFVMKRPDRCVIAKELYWGDGMRPRPQDQLALDVFARLVEKTALVFDVGAYTGLFSLLAARVNEDVQVHAFEMVPEVAKAALDNVVANDLVGRVFVHVQGIGRDGDTAQVPSGEGGSALPDYLSTHVRDDRGVTVPIRSLDAVAWDLPEERRTAPAVVKIDVEGTEDVVLQNAQQFLRSNRPDLICEVLPDHADLNRIHAALRPHGYRYLRFGAGELVEFPQVEPDSCERDWLFTTKTDDGLRALGVPVASP